MNYNCSAEFSAQEQYLFVVDDDDPVHSSFCNLIAEEMLN
jgi:hypothetical protein